MESIQFIGTSPTALIDLIDKRNEKRFEELKNHFQPKEPEEYLTRNEVSKLLKIDLSSVHNWTKRKILTAYQCGGRVYFKRSEVESALVELKK